MQEIISIRDYLAKPPARTRATDKDVIVDIPTLKVFERAILYPNEQQCKPLEKKYPKDGDNLFGKLKEKKGKKKGGKKGKKKR